MLDPKLRRFLSRGSGPESTLSKAKQLKSALAPMLRLLLQVPIAMLRLSANDFVPALSLVPGSKEGAGHLRRATTPCAKANLSTPSEFSQSTSSSSSEAESKTQMSKRQMLWRLALKKETTMKRQEMD